MSGGPAAVVCVDIGSTWTKAALVDLVERRVVARAEAPTTLTTDVLDGVDACRRQLARADARALDAEVRACSSAGGGLRIAVVGAEQLVTAEAGRRVALSSGGHVVQVVAGLLDEPAVRDLAAAHPDVVLLVGGTDGGNREVVRGNAEALAAVSWSTPVVLAGNVEARPEAEQALARAGVRVVTAGNVLPRIGTLAPAAARAAIRQVFVEHVIGGKHLSARPELARLVRAATPDAVLAGVEVLARGRDEGRPGIGDVVVVDVGGATTDVYSAVDPVLADDDPESGALQDVVGSVAVTRTVEGDLGVRWSAPTTASEARTAGLVPERWNEGHGEQVAAAAARLRARPADLPQDAADDALEAELAAWALGLALRRHAGRSSVRFAVEGGTGVRVVEREGVDLRRVRVLVAGGGVVRHRDWDADRLLAHVSSTGGWQLPDDPHLVVDDTYALMPAGLLAPTHPDVAYEVARQVLAPRAAAP